MVIEIAAGVLLSAAAAFAGLWWRARAGWTEAVSRVAAAERDRARLNSILAAAPAIAFCWHSGDSGEVVYGRPSGGSQITGYAGFCAGLARPDAERLDAAVSALRQRGTVFAATVTTAAGTVYELDGHCAANGDALVWLSDVTAVHRAEQARAKAVAAAELRRAMLDALPIPVWRRDAELRIDDCNEALAAMLDMPRDTILASPDADMIRPLAQAAVSAGAVRSERRHVVIGGSRHMFGLMESPLPAGGTIGFAIDHTAIETAESELQRHINAHGQVLESINTAVAIYGAHKRLNFHNSAFTALWGLEEEWLSTEPSLDELLEQLRERRRVPEYADFRAFKRQQLAMFTSLIEPQTELMHLPDGRTLSVSVSPHPLGGLMFVYEDVTDRLALERSYNTLIEVQRATLDNLFEAIAVFGSDGRLKLHNPAYRQMWGLSEDDVVGEPRIADIIDKLRHFFIEDDWAVARQQIAARITSQTLWTGQVDRADGTILQLATVPLPDGAVLFTGQDVTDSARVERALRESNEALETAAQLKSEFIANVSYELRTPLNAIMGFAEILSNQYFGPLSERQLEYSRGILASSHRLMSLINDILDLATIEAGYLALDTGHVDIAELLDSVMVLTKERARSQDLDLSLHCPADIGVIEGDERRLKQAMFNLVSNAMKFTPSGQSVAIQARLDGGDLVLAVADTGIGIPQADQERIFEKFERGKPNSREAGAGLGLSLVKSLIELHGGSVSLESAPGRGTTVYCRLPASLRVRETEAAG